MTMLARTMCLYKGYRPALTFVRNSCVSMDTMNGDTAISNPNLTQYPSKRAHEFTRTPQRYISVHMEETRVCSMMRVDTRSTVALSRCCLVRSISPTFGSRAATSIMLSTHEATAGPVART